METVYSSLDLGGTNIAGAIATADGTILAQESRPTHSEESPDRVLARMAELIRDLETRTGYRAEALGVGAPGWVDRKLGVSRWLPNMVGGWKDTPIADTLSCALGRPTFVLNDARMATLGEWTYGHGRDGLDLALFGLGTGVGGGVVVGGRLLLGPYGSAGELGHQIVVPDGRSCGCGGRGCLEAYASAPALTGEGVRLMLSGQAPCLQAITAGDASRVTPSRMAKAASQGDAKVVEAIRTVGYYLGLAVCNVVVTVHPSKVVITGGMAGLGEPLFAEVERTLCERVRVFSPDEVSIVPSQLDGNAGVLGGIALASSGGLG